MSRTFVQRPHLLDQCSMHMTLCACVNGIRALRNACVTRSCLARAQSISWLMFGADCLPVVLDLELQDPEAPLGSSVEGQFSQKQYYVFVYGSLLPDLHNHGLIISKTEFLGYHKTQPPLTCSRWGSSLQFVMVDTQPFLGRYTASTAQHETLWICSSHLVSSRTSGASDQEAHARLVVPHVARGARDQGQLGQASPIR